MIKNMFIIAIRSLLKQRFYTFLNLAGLTIGLAVFLMISLIVSYQLSYDNHHPYADQIYRIDQTFIWGDAIPTFGSTGPGVGKVLKERVPGIQNVTRVYPVGEKYVNVPAHPDQKSFEEAGILAVDSTFFKVYQFPFVAGDKETALNAPYTAIMSESAAHRYFGEQEAVGKFIKIADGRNDALFQITGIVKDVPKNTHFTFEILTSMTSYPEVIQRSETWFWSGFVTYVLLEPKADSKQVAELIFDFPNQYAGQAYESVTSGGREWHLYLQPVKDIWLHTLLSPNRLGPTGNILHVYILVAIALVILVLAIVNYINMATARSFNRSREVGIRKVMGAQKQQLILQFLAESFVLTICAALLSVYLVELAIPFFNKLTGNEMLTMSLFENWGKIGIFIAIVVFTALLSGTYPAFFMTKFQPVFAMKKAMVSDKKGILLRSGLVVFQFTLGISLVVLSFIFYSQLNFIQNKNLGFDKNNLVVVPHVQRMDSIKRLSFHESVKNHPAVQSVGLSTSVPPYIWDGDSFRSEEQPNIEVPISFLHVNESYLQTLDLNIAAGRIFSEDFEGDRQHVVLNENAVKTLGWDLDESVIGKKLIYGKTRFTIIGVLTDFHYRSLDGPIEPLAIFTYGAPIYHGNAHFITVRLKENMLKFSQVEGFLSFLENQWNTFAPDLPFNYQFTDDLYFQAFEFEQRLSKIFLTFTILAIIIACIGLLGLAAYVAETRSKEIGIRKVLGASVRQVVVLVSGDFAKLVFLSFLIAVPLSWWIGHEWLKNYEYRIDIGWPLFAYAGITALTVSILTVSYQAIKTALTNPVEILRDE